jgi:hypothetical protein
MSLAQGQLRLRCLVPGIGIGIQIFVDHRIVIDCRTRAESQLHRIWSSLQNKNDTGKLNHFACHLLTVVIGLPQSNKVLAFHIAELYFFPVLNVLNVSIIYKTVVIMKSKQINLKNLPRIKVSKRLIASSLLSLRTEQSEHFSPQPEKGEPLCKR